MANRVDPDLTQYFAASDLGLHFLLRHVSPKIKVYYDIFYFGINRVRTYLFK